MTGLETLVTKAQFVVALKNSLVPILGPEKQ